MLSMLPYALKQQIEKDVLKAYVTDALRMITENTAKMSRTGGSYMPCRYTDIIAGTSKKSAPEKTAEEIVNDVITRTGIKVHR